MGADITNELLKAIVTASDEQKRQALRILRGEPDEAVQPRQTEPFLLLVDVARLLNVHYTTLWKWGVPGHELGGRRRFRMSEVEAYLESDEFKKRVRLLKAERKRRRAGTPRDSSTPEERSMTVEDAQQ